jgi:hypothetical protein
LPAGSVHVPSYAGSIFKSNFLVVTLHASSDISCQSYSVTITDTPVALRFQRKYHPVCKLNGISDAA